MAIEPSNNTGAIPSPAFLQETSFVEQLNMVSLRMSEAGDLVERRKWMDEENKLLLYILRENAATGVMPDGVEIHTLVYKTQDDLTRVAPELAERGFITFPQIHYTLANEKTDKVHTAQIIETILQESDFNIPFEVAAKEARDLISRLPCEERDIFSLPIPLVRNDIFEATQSERQINVYHAKYKSGRLDRQIANESISQIQETVAELICHSVAALMAYETPYQFHVINDGYYSEGENNFSFHVYLPSFYGTYQNGYKRFNVTIPASRTDMIDFLLRIEGKGWTRQRLSRRPISDSTK